MRCTQAWRVTLAATLLCSCRGPAPVSEGEHPWDFIVVGAGAGGGPLAARLAERGHRVLLLDAGRDLGEHIAYQVPAYHALSTERADAAWWYFVQHHADPELDRADSKWTPEGILYPRGTGLGGSTAVNAMVTVLPSPWDWDRLAQITGDPTWRAAAMAPYYARVRQWLSVEVPEPELGLDDPVVSGMLQAAAVVQAGGEGVGATHEMARVFSADVNQTLLNNEATGLFRLPLATRDGRRSGPRQRIIDVVEAGHPLDVQLGAFVTRVIFEPRPDGLTAVGVELVQHEDVYGASLVRADAPSARVQAFANHEVILAAGAFNTPQLLMLSGIGDPAALQAAGVQPQVRLDGVGQNLQDRYEGAVVAELERPISLVEHCQLGESLAKDPCLQDWLRGEGVYRTSGFLATMLRRTSPEAPSADLQIFGVPGDARGYYPGYSQDALTHKDRFTWLLLKGHTGNRDGTVRLRSSDPFMRPKVSFNSFDEAHPEQDPDLLALVQGVRVVREVLARAQRDHLEQSVTEIWPGPDKDTDASLGTHLRREAWGHHACCTSAMGAEADPQAVLDARFRVRGVKQLRVVDASVFPEIPGTFIALPTFMVSERAADVICEDYP